MPAPPTFSIVAAMTHTRVIGVRNTLPWHLSADLKRFKALTLGHHIIMGRKTYESIGRPLPGRENIVISSQALTWPGIHVVPSLAAALSIPAAVNQKRMVIGGGQIWGQALAQYPSHIERMHLTLIDEDFEGDAWFPAFDWDAWNIEREERGVQEGERALHYRWVDLVPRVVRA